MRPITGSKPAHFTGIKTNSIAMDTDSSSAETRHTTEQEALYSYAHMMNTGEVEHLEALLPIDFTYESQAVFEALPSKTAFMEYIRPKLKAVATGNAPVFADMGEITIGTGRRSCVVLAQGDESNVVAFVLATVKKSVLRRLDLCLTPPPASARRRGSYPGL